MDTLTFIYDAAQKHVDVTFCIMIVFASYMVLKNISYTMYRKTPKTRIVLVVALAIGVAKCLVELVIFKNVVISSEYIWTKIITYCVSTSLYDIIIKRLISNISPSKELTE